MNVAIIYVYAFGCICGVCLTFVFLSWVAEYKPQKAKELFDIIRLKGLCRKIENFKMKGE